MRGQAGYRGRLAPSPTGPLHVGHARTFSVAAARARAAGGALVLRMDDLDQARCREDFVPGILEDLRWLGLTWTEGPDIGGPYGPYEQSRRIGRYREALERLHRTGAIYPSWHSRGDIAEAAGAPHETDDEPVFPAHLRPAPGAAVASLEEAIGANWRLRVPDGEELCFEDARLGTLRAIAGVDFGDFPVWRKDGCPSYQLACVVDDAHMAITEVVRGEDLVRSTFRQLLVYRALGLRAPRFLHCALVAGEDGVRLSKRAGSLGIGTLRAQGASPESICARWGFGDTPGT